MNKRRLRYLLVKILAEKAITDRAFSLGLETAVEHLFGHVGLVEISPRVVSYNHERSTALVRCSAEGVQKLRATLALITEMENNRIAAFILGVSGTMRCLRQRLSIKCFPESRRIDSSLARGFGTRAFVSSSGNRNQ